MTEQKPDLTPEEQAFRARLLASAERLDIPTPRLKGRLLAQIPPEPRWRAWRWGLGAGVGLMAVAAGVFLVRRAVEPLSPVLPEPAERRVLADPCAHALRAAGGAPRIDDFEDSDSMSLLAEGRGTPWMLFFDYDVAAVRFLTPEYRPEPEPDNRYGLNLSGPLLRDWGASIQLRFHQGACYDASAYRGIELWARGPGRVFVGVREVNTTPRRWGGTCDEDCYNDHLARLDLEETWQHYQVEWEEMRQRGYDTRPVDPSSLHTLVILVRAEDSPFDLWIDDIGFLPASP